MDCKDFLRFQDHLLFLRLDTLTLKCVFNAFCLKFTLCISIFNILQFLTSYIRIPGKIYWKLRFLGPTHTKWIRISERLRKFSYYFFNFHMWLSQNWGEPWLKTMLLLDMKYALQAMGSIKTHWWSTHQLVLTCKQPLVCIPQPLHPSH